MILWTNAISTQTWTYECLCCLCKQESVQLHAQSQYTHTHTHTQIYIYIQPTKSLDTSTFKTRVCVCVYINLSKYMYLFFYKSSACYFLWLFSVVSTVIFFSVLAAFVYFWVKAGGTGTFWARVRRVYMWEYTLHLHYLGVRLLKHVSLTEMALNWIFLSLILFVTVFFFLMSYKCTKWQFHLITADTLLCQTFYVKILFSESKH